MAKVVRWPQLDILESSGKTIDEFYVSTEKGPILAGLLFPLSQLDRLKDIRARFEAARKTMNDIEAEIYKVPRHG